jgi:drug/metabolite transporter (DMT)-like permease
MSGIHDHNSLELRDAPCPFSAMAGLVPAIHVFAASGNQDVDARPKAGHAAVPKETPSVNDKISRPLDAFAVIVMLAVTLSWGFNQVSVKLALPEIPPLIQATLRSIGALGAMLLWARVRGVPMDLRDGTLLPGIAAGVLFGLEFLLLFPALQFTGASRATLFVNTAPFFVALGSTVFLGERLRAVQWAGLVLSFAGLVVAFGIPDPAAGGRQFLGDAMVVVAGAVWAATTLVIKGSSLRTAASEKVFVYQIGGSIPVLALGVLLVGERMTAMPSAWAIGWLAYNTFWVVTVTFMVWFMLVQRYSPSRLSAFTFLTPLFGVGWGHFVLGEAVSWAFGAAVALVLAGLILVNRPG